MPWYNEPAYFLILLMATANIKKDEVKKSLEARAEALRAQLNDLSDEDPKKNGRFETKFQDYGDSLEDAATETEQYIDDLSVERSLELRLGEVEGALERLRKGTYGICESCKKPISERRLSALPEARLCIKCESK